MGAAVPVGGGDPAGRTRGAGPGAWSVLVKRFSSNSSQSSAKPVIVAWSYLSASYSNSRQAPVGDSSDMTVRSNSEVPGSTPRMRTSPTADLRSSSAA